MQNMMKWEKRAKGRLNGKNGSTTLVVTTLTIMNIPNVRGSVGMGGYPKTLKLPKFLTLSKCHDNLHSKQISQEVLTKVSSRNLAPQCQALEKWSSYKWIIQNFHPKSWTSYSTRATWSSALKVEQREPFL
jgi:hypothetical protein